MGVVKNSIEARVIIVLSSRCLKEQDSCNFIMSLLVNEKHVKMPSISTFFLKKLKQKKKKF